MRTPAIASALVMGVLCVSFEAVNQQVLQKAPLVAQPQPLPQLFTFITDYPRDRNTDWTGDLQGVAHDNNNWFFTEAFSKNKEDWLIKFPVTYDLRNGVPDDPGPAGVISNKKSRVYPHLNAWWHMGDLAEFEGYLFVPMNSKTAGRTSIIGLFKARDLSYAHHVEVPDAPPATGGNGPRRKTNIGWCAVRRSGPSEGLLYTSNENIAPDNPIDIYRFDLNRLKLNQLVLTHAGSLAPVDECGRPLVLRSMQGGEFSTDGRLLFLTNGYCELAPPNSGADCWGREGSESEGLMVFDARTGVRVSKAMSGSGLFNYEYHYIGGSYAQEPEGVTYWDLDADTRAPGIRGQLHAIVLDNNAGDSDTLFFKHYRADPVSGIAEDLVPLDSARAVVERAGAGWRIAAGPVDWFRFNRESDARQALRILQGYRVDTVGYVGRPDPSLTYLLAGGRAPSGASGGEDCLAFNPSGIRIRRQSSRWLVVEGTTDGGGPACRQLFAFSDGQEREARAAYAIIRKYGFGQVCYVGRPNPAFTYLRR